MEDQIRHSKNVLKTEKIIIIFLINDVKNMLDGKKNLYELLKKKILWGENHMNKYAIFKECYFDKIKFSLFCFYSVTSTFQSPIKRRICDSLYTFKQFFVLHISQVFSIISNFPLKRGEEHE